MRKSRAEYDSAVDALVSVSKRLSVYEERHGMESEEFYDRFAKGKADDSEDSIEWVNDYRHYLALRQDIETQLRHAG